MSLSKKNSNLCKYSTIYFQSLTYFCIAFSIITSPTILVDGYQFQSLSSLDAYIDTLEYGKEQFAVEQQGLEFYTEYIGLVAEQGSDFARKVKEKKLWQRVGQTKENLDTLAKPLHDYNVAYQTSHSSRDIAIKTITAKQEEKTVDYIRNYNPSENQAKKCGRLP